MVTVMKVLILENDRTFQRSLSYFIQSHGNWEVYVASSKNEGASLFKSISFDMVLCGDRLPDGNGLEILKDWTEQKPNLISILMTVQSDETLRQKALESGVRCCLVKPFDLKQLEEAISISDGALPSVEQKRKEPK